jgi:hypothetical protein
MSDNSFERIIGLWVESVVVHVPAIEMCLNSRIVGHLWNDNTSTFTCASKLEVAIHQAFDVFLKLQQVCRRS